jgi:DNA-binding GntR family transcriptional regulator
MKNHESYLESPFRILGIEERHFVTKESEEILQLTDGDDLYAVRRIPKNKMQLHDSVKYTKLFQDSFKSFMNLSPAALKILLYSMCNVRPLSKVTILHAPDLMLNCLIKSEATIKTAITELVDEKILARKLGSTIEFWINPNIYFNGNRIRIL